jgi:ABC-type transport system substrate-binding protein
MFALIAAMFFVSPIAAQNSPRTGNFLIHVYLTDTAEFSAFESDTGASAIDIVDWPLSPDKVALYLNNPDIQLRDYSDVGAYEVDINDQRWPTGVTEPRTYDPATNSYKHYYGTSPWDSVATEFRRGISYLSNKGKWITDILKGYGHRMDTMVPYGALAGWTDYTALRAAGYIYDFDTLKARDTFNAAGFIEGTTPNPYYDPATPGSAQFLRTDPRYGGNLETLAFYIRMDDILRRDMGRDLTAQMRKAGLSVNPIETDRTVCYNQVMVLYDFHLYTGGWSLSVDVPNTLYGLHHSSQYWGGTSTSYYGGVGWAGNYDGTVDDAVDTAAELGKFGGSFADVKSGGLAVQARVAQLAALIPGYDRAAVKAFKTGWTGILNYRGFGPDNFYSFVEGQNTVNTGLNPADNRIDYGFKSTLSGPNPITTQWVWDSYLVGLMYDSMIGRNPFDLSMEYGLAAESWAFNAADSSATYTLRSGLTFHNGDPLTVQDIKFSLEFMRACGPGVNWGFDSVDPITRVDTSVQDPSLGPRTVKVYFNTPSYWALHWAGFNYILNKNVWMSANAAKGWGYNQATMGLDWTKFTNRNLVRDYNPWVEDSDSDGTTDFQEDGSGPWVFGSWAPTGPISAATSISLTAFNNYAISANNLQAFTNWAFHQIGDTNEDGHIDTVDGLAIQRALGTDSSMLPWGSGWDQYNPATDIPGTWNSATQTPLATGDGAVNYLDIGMWGLNYGGIP